MNPASGSKIPVLAAFFILVTIKIVLLNQVLSSGTMGPLGLSDELIYRLNAESIFNRTTYYSDHYPPFYPLLLSFAFFSKHNWYQWMLYTNAVLSSLVLVPVWFISRRFLSFGSSLSVLLLSSLSAYHVFYPGLIMSENIHVPVFVFSVYLLFHTGKGPRSRRVAISALLGITMALGYMTKYIYLVAIPVLVILWFIKPLFFEDTEDRAVCKACRWAEFLAMAAGFISLFLPWYIYKYYSGFGIGGGLGAQFVVKGIPVFSDLQHLLLWTGFYLTYSLVSLSPFLVTLVFYMLKFSSHHVKNHRHEIFFILGVILLSTIFFMTAVQHSWRAGYNYPVPYRLHGRYLMHLMPLWAVVFMMALDKVKYVVVRSNLSHRVYSCFVCLILLLLPLILLALLGYTRMISDSYPVYLIQNKKFFSIFAAMMIMLMGLILIVSSWNKFIARHYVLLMLTLVIAVHLGMASSAYSYMLFNREGFQLQSRALMTFIAEEVSKHHDKIIIVSDQSDLLGRSARWVAQSLQFWVSESMKIPSIEFISLDEFLSHRGEWNGKLYGITANGGNHPVYTYNVKGKNYYVYDTDAWPGGMTGIMPGRPSSTGGDAYISRR